ncbi:TetR/AcrR family transcriptional regulator [Haloarcula salina]|uniref:TetR/AcrR family transcriptional regulator n=1 Tax=Haloarcula salina TaxID=1429914 RepID=A0AA41KHG8_9EURY|nr:TetR/AcrR family transcriptional regulator [Haloarcula salina]MBV0900593.1 TetR/AcrR family transcriptional regulator [Haloarcula salina]
MSDRIPFAGDPEDSHEAIMRATFCALQEYGYAGLSIQRIADEADLSKSTFYHHFDGKEDLLLSFQEFMLAQFDRIVQLESTGDPEQDLKTFLGLILDDLPDYGEMPEKDAVLRSLVELRAQAVHNAEFREKYAETDEQFAKRFEGLIRDGIEQGEFADVDPERTSQMLLTILHGAILQHATRDDDPAVEIRETIDEYIEQHLVVEDVAGDA